MIVYKTGNMFNSDAQVVVNPVNTVGAMGAGIALQVKRRNKHVYDTYQTQCHNGNLKIGTLQLLRLDAQHFVLNFPTKQDWRQPSKLSYIEAGLVKFCATYQQKHIKSIAFPPLGCGKGQLDFKTQVLPLMLKYLAPLEDITVEIYTK